MLGDLEEQGLPAGLVQMDPVVAGAYPPGRVTRQPADGDDFVDVVDSGAAHAAGVTAVDDVMQSAPVTEELAADPAVLAVALVDCGTYVSGDLPRLTFGSAARFSGRQWWSPPARHAQRRDGSAVCAL